MNMTRIRITTYCRSKLHRTKHHYNPALHDELSVTYIKHHSISLQSSHPSAIPRSWTTSKAQLDALRQQISDQTNQPGRQRLGEYRPFIKGVCAANGTWYFHALWTSTTGSVKLSQGHAPRIHNTLQHICMIWQQRIRVRSDGEQRYLMYTVYICIYVYVSYTRVHVL